MKPSPNWRSLALFGVAALLVVATAPYFVPMRPAVSDSYIFGYNNRAGILLFLLFAVVGALWVRNKNLPDPNAAPKAMPYWLMWFGLVISAAMCWGMYRLTAQLNGFAESTYFIQRLNLLAAGRVPYRDFEFAYGAALLYVPLWISHAFHLSLTAAFYLFWSLCVALGVVTLFESIRLAGDPRHDRAGLFLLLLIISLFGILSTGPNYMELRFVLPLYFAALIFRLRRRESGSWLSFSATLLGAATLLLISPEMAVAFAIGSLLYFALNLSWSDKPAVFSLGALLCALAALFVAANCLGVFATMRAFSAGGNNFPIYIAPYIALFFALVCFGFHYFEQRLRQHRREDLFVYWILLATVLLPAALGRCDLGHIFLYESGMFLAVGLFLSGRPKPRFWIRIAGAAYILLILIPALRVEYIPLTASAAAHASGSGLLRRYAVLVLGEARVQSIQQTSITPHIDAPDEKLLAPFAYLPNGSGVFAAPSIEYGYYDALTNVLTPEQVQFKLDEIRRNPEMELLLPSQWVSYCVRTADNSRVLLSGLFGVPYIKEPAHEMDLYMPVCDYIRAHYRYVPTRAGQALGNYDLWARKANQ